MVDVPFLFQTLDLFDLLGAVIDDSEQKILVFMRGNGNPSIFSDSVSPLDVGMGLGGYLLQKVLKFLIFIIAFDLVSSQMSKDCVQ